MTRPTWVTFGAILALTCWLGMMPALEFIRANKQFLFYFAIDRDIFSIITCLLVSIPVFFLMSIWVLASRFGPAAEMAFVRAVLSLCAIGLASQATTKVEGAAGVVFLAGCVLLGALALLAIAKKPRELFGSLAFAGLLVIPATGYLWWDVRDALKEGQNVDLTATRRQDVNVYMLLIDGSDITSSYLDESGWPRADVLPNLHRIFKEGFDWYPNAVSNGVQTYLSVPTMFTGRIAANEANGFLRQEPTIFSLLYGRFKVRGLFRAGSDNLCQQRPDACAPFKSVWEKSEDPLSAVLRFLAHRWSFGVYKVDFKKDDILVRLSKGVLNEFLALVSKSKDDLGLLFFGHMSERPLRDLRVFDGAFAAFIAHLRAVGIYDQSIIILMSDHGFDASQPCLYGTTCIPNERILRVPLAIKRAGQQMGQVDEYPAQNIDILPTLMGLLGEQHLIEAIPIDGIDLYKARDQRPWFFNAGQSLPLQRTPLVRKFVK